MTTLLARRLTVAPDEPAALCARLGLRPPPGFDSQPGAVRTAGLLVDGAVHRCVAAGLAATCAPALAVLMSSTVGDVAAAFGVRGDLGGSMIRAGGSGVELAAWPAERLGAELARAVPPLGLSAQPPLHLPLAEIAMRADLQAEVVGILRATVVAPPHVVGLVGWLATAAGWLAIEPAEARAGVRWATVRPVVPVDIGAAVAPLVGSALT